MYEELLGKNGEVEKELNFLNSEFDFQIPSVYADSVARPNAQKLPSIFKRIIIMGGLLAAFVTVGFYSLQFLRMFYQNETKIGQVYVELKMIDEDGRPLSGVTISMDSSALGRTDSFGEWRSYLSLELGSDFSLKFEKRRRSHNVKITKNFAVSLRRENKNKIEIVKVIKMPMGGIINDTNQSHGRSAKVSEKQFPPHFSVEFLPATIAYAKSKPLQAKLRNEIVPGLRAALKKHISEASSLNGSRINIQHIEVENGKGLILVEVRNTGKHEGVDFLFNYRADSAETVRSLAESLMRPDFGSPKNWQTFTARIVGMRKSHKIFFSGYSARPDSQGRWIFKGTKGAKSNVTVLDKNRRVVLRTSVINSLERPPVIAVPSRDIAYRP